MKNKILNITLLLSIILIGLIIRLCSIDKPEGLWNDEYMAWWISSFNFGAPLFKKIFLNCHMPLYYLFLKIWCFAFGNTDIALRLSSVLIGILNILSMYFLGKEYKNKTTGLICALFSALSGFLIYFSQEVRPYGLIFLICTWICFFFIKAIRTPNRFNISIYLIFNFLLLITHTLGFVYSFFNLLIFSVVLTKNRPNIRPLVFSGYIILIACFLPLTPFLITILTRNGLSQNWGIFNLSKIFFVFLDYLTPIQTNITNSPINILACLKNLSLFSSLFYVIIPFSLGLSFYVISLKRKELLLNVLNLCSLLYFIVLVIAAISGKIILSTKYSVEIYPAIILAVSSAFSVTHSKAIKYLAWIYFILISICLIFYPQAPQRLPRSEGHKTPALLLNNADINQDDYIITLYHQFFRYKKYTNLNPKNLIELDKGSVATYLMGNGYGETDIKLNAKKELKSAFLFQNEKDITKRFDDIFNKIPKNKKIAIIIPTQVAFFSSNDLIRIASTKEEYENTQVLFLVFSYAKIKLINAAFSNCEFKSIYEQGPWVILTFTKK